MSELVSRAADPRTAADRRVLVRLAQGDSSAMMELYDTHARTLYALAVRIVSDTRDAEDVVQDVFAQAWRQASRYDSQRATVIGWLLMMTRARAIDRLRARAARPDSKAPAALPDLPSVEPNQETAVCTHESVTKLGEALRGLGDAFRIPIELAYYEGLSQSAIAERLGHPLGTVKTRMRTALSKLRTTLQSEG